MKENWHVYICQAGTGRYYAGIAKDPKRRLTKHNNSDGAKLARDQGPFKLVYTSVPYPNNSEARIREVQIKGWSRLKKENLISGKWV